MVSVRLSDRATTCLESQDDFLRAHSPLAANRLLSDVERALSLLSEHPLAGPVAPGRPYHILVTRRYRYRLIYEVDGNDVLILDILHPSQSAL